MSGFLIATLMLAAGSAVALILPTLSKSKARGALEAERAVYRDQLLELERDLGRGVIDPQAAAAARNEIERRIIRAAKQAERSPGPDLLPHRAGQAVVIISGLVLLPLSTASLYFALGTPGEPDLPFAEREAPGPQIPPEAYAMVERLEERLQRTPDDLDGLKRLAHSKQVIGDIEGAIDALRRAIERAPGDLDVQANLGEALVAASAGIINPEAVALFEAIQQSAPYEPRSGYYLGLAAIQAGNGQEAYDRWYGLLANTPLDAPWRATLVQSIAQASARVELEIGDMLQAAPNPAIQGVDPETAARFDAMSPDERQSQIRTMVDRLQSRLDQHGGDAEEWRRLGRALNVLGRHSPSKTAYEKALELAPDDVAIRRDYAMSLIGEPDPETNLPSIGDAALEQLQALNNAGAADAEIHWYLGVRALQERDRNAARHAWMTALSLLPEQHPDREMLTEFVDQLSD